jgi:hypothetical protein
VRVSDVCNSSPVSSTQAFLWDLRYSLLNRAELLPAFVMSVRWSSSEQVQELYDLLDLWAPPSSVQALQLLDRRFMDPKVRAYAVHCLEELPDDELALYMLQLCQQLKFERYVNLLFFGLVSSRLCCISLPVAPHEMCYEHLLVYDCSSL